MTIAVYWDIKHQYNQPRKICICISLCCTCTEVYPYSTQNCLLIWVYRRSNLSSKHLLFPSLSTNLFKLADNVYQLTGVLVVEHMKSHDYHVTVSLIKIRCLFHIVLNKKKKKKNPRGKRQIWLLQKALHNLLYIYHFCTFVTRSCFIKVECTWFEVSHLTG